MPLILRSVKGSNLTANEVDGNFTFLSSSINNVVSGSVTVTSASYALSASNAATASLAPAYLPLTGGTISGNLVVNGTGSFNYVVSNYESSSIIYTSGSTKFGNSQDDLHEFTGSVSISGSSLTLNNNAVVMSNQTSSMSVATASYVTLAQTASYVTTAQTASYINGANVSGAVANAESASHALVALASNTSATASYVSGTFVITSVISPATGALFINSTGDGLNIGTGASSSFVHIGKPSLSVDIFGVVNISGSLTSENVFLTGSLLGTSSYTLQSLTSSYTTNAETLDGLDSSVFVQTGSFNSFTSSYNTASGSLSTRVTSLEDRTTNLEITSSGLTSASGSFSTRTTNLESASGSFSTRVTSLESFSSSLDSVYATDAQLNAATQSLSASLATSISSSTVIINNLITNTGSYAITGSNIFRGNQAIIGDGSGYATYISTSVNDSTLGLDSSAAINALYLLKGGDKKFEISFDTTNINPIFRLLPYTGSSFFEIGNPSNAGSDYVLISEPTYGNVLLGPGLSNGDGIVSGATPSIHKVQIKGGMFVSGSITATSFNGTINATNGVVSGSSQVISLLPAGTVSGSSQILNGSGIWSGSAQLPSGVISGSSQVSYDGLSNIPSGIVSGSSQVISLLPAGTVSGSSQVSYDGLSNIPSGIVSGSSQVSYTGLSNIPSGIVSGSSQIDATATTNWATGIKTELNNNTVISGSSQVYGLISSLNTYTGSNDSTNTTQNSRLVSIESKTGSFATTGSNTLVGTQYISNTTDATSFSSTAALYTDGGLRVSKNAYVSGTIYVNNLTVYGTQSVAYITSSQADFGTNIITVNTNSPSIRFGGYAVFDSGSTGTGRTGSLLWDSQEDHWIYTVPSGSAEGYNSAILIAGPPNTGSLGSEVGLTSGKITVALGNDHIGNSIMNQVGSVVYVTGSLSATSINATSLTGSLGGSNLVAGSVANDRLTTSAITIAGNSTSLGGSITAATILSGTGVFSGSAQVTGLTNSNLSGTAGISNANLANSAITIAGSSTSLGGSISASTIGNAIGAFSGSAQVDHNSTTNYVANQHIDHTTVSISAGSGLSGGGTIAATRTLTLDTSSAHFINGSRASISVSDTTGASGIDLTYSSGVISGVLANSAVTVTAGTGLSGGGSVSLGSSVTLSNAGVTSLTSNTGLSSNVSATGAVTITNTGVTSNIAGTGISVSGATGAVTITNTGVTSITAGTGISVNTGTGGVTVTNTITNNNQLTNGSGYITGITSGNVTTALGYTPYNATNPNGYITGITSGNVTTALGYTPYNATNPSGYQTTSGTVAKVENTVGGSSAVDLMYGNMADNDQFRIRIGGTSSNNGFVEIATADDGTEPIHVRQYTGVFSSLARTATLLDGSGNTSFPGSVTAGGDITAYSDASVKENIKTIENALDKVLALRGVTYTRIDLEDKSEKIGVIAQETREVVPQVVSEGEDGKLSVAYGNLGGLFIEAIKNQQTLIHSQQSQIDELKELVNQLLNK
jgi:hypothetical protein